MSDLMETENQDALQQDLPARIKVTVSREDGAPLFDRDEGPDVEWLTKDAPVLVIRRDGGGTETIVGDEGYVIGILLERLKDKSGRSRRRKN